MNVEFYPFSPKKVLFNFYLINILNIDIKKTKLVGSNGDDDVFSEKDDSDSDTEFETEETIVTIDCEDQNIIAVVRCVYISACKQAARCPCRNAGIAFYLDCHNEI